MASRPHSATPTVNIVGACLHNVSRLELFHLLDCGGVLLTPNVDMILKMRRQPDFCAVADAAEIRICDSQIVLWASRFLGTPLKEKIAGSDLLGEFCAHHARRTDVKIFLLGSARGVAQEARRRLNARTGREIVVGAHSPTFGFESNEEECDALLDLVNESGASVLVVGVGSPKQELFIARYRPRLSHVRLLLALGATIDFEAGHIPRAPGWMQSAGLEWAFRLVREPKRLSRRYLLDDPPFFWFLLRQRLGRDGFSKRCQPSGG